MCAESIFTTGAAFPRVVVNIEPVLSTYVHTYRGIRIKYLIFIYMYILIYKYTYIYYTHIHTYIHIHIDTYLSIYTYTHTHTLTHIIYIYITSVYICMYIYIRIYVHRIYSIYDVHSGLKEHRGARRLLLNAIRIGRYISVCDVSISWN